MIENRLYVASPPAALTAWVLLWGRICHHVERRPAASSHLRAG